MRNSCWTVRLLSVMTSWGGFANSDRSACSSLWPVKHLLVFLMFLWSVRFRLSSSQIHRLPGLSASTSTQDTQLVTRGGSSSMRTMTFLRGALTVTARIASRLGTALWSGKRSFITSISQAFCKLKHRSERYSPEIGQ